MCLSRRTCAATEAASPRAPDHPDGCVRWDPPSPTISHDAERGAEMVATNRWQHSSAFITSLYAVIGRTPCPRCLIPRRMSLPVEPVRCAFPLVAGGPKGIRTPDLLAASQALYQLSYGPEGTSLRDPDGRLPRRLVVSSRRWRIGRDPEADLRLAQRAEETAPGSSHSSRGASRQRRSRS